MSSSTRTGSAIYLRVIRSRVRTPTTLRLCVSWPTSTSTGSGLTRKWSTILCTSLKTRGKSLINGSENEPVSTMSLSSPSFRKLPLLLCLRWPKCSLRCQKCLKWATWSRSECSRTHLTIFKMRSPNQLTSTPFWIYTIPSSSLHPSKPSFSLIWPLLVSWLNQQIISSRLSSPWCKCNSFCNKSNKWCNRSSSLPSSIRIAVRARIWDSCSRCSKFNSRSFSNRVRVTVSETFNQQHSLRIIVYKLLTIYLETFKLPSPPNKTLRILTTGASSICQRARRRHQSNRLTASPNSLKWTRAAKQNRQSSTQLSTGDAHPKMNLFVHII